MALGQILLAPHVGVDVTAVQADIVKQTIVEGRKLASCAPTIADIGDPLAQAGEKAWLLALRQSHGLPRCGMDLATADAEVPQLVIIQLGEFANGLLVQAPDRSLLSSAEAELPEEAPKQLRDVLRPQSLRVTQEDVDVVCLALFELDGGAFSVL